MSLTTFVIDADFRSMHRVLRGAAGGLFWFLAGFSCGDDPSGPTRDSPLFDVVFPTAQAFDRDEDGLVDLEIAFSQTGSPVDLSTLEIRSDRPLGPNGQGGRDLMDGFEVVSLDGEAAVLEETTDAILPDGEVEIRVRAEDQTGASSEEAVTITLPAGAFHRYLESGIVITGLEPFGVEVVPDDTVGFLLTTDHVIVPFHTRKLEVLPPLSTGAIRDPVDGVWDPVSGRMFIVSIATGHLLAIDPKTLTIEAPISLSARGTGIERGPTSGLLYVSLATREASIAVVDPVARAQVRLIQTDVIDPLNPQDDAFIGNAGIPTEEDRIYVPRKVTPGGVVVVNPLTGEVLEEIDIGASANTLGLGLPNDSVLDRLHSRLFVTDVSSPPLGGLAEVDIETNMLLRRIDSADRTGRAIALSPSSRRVLVTMNTVRGAVGQAENWLVDPASFSILQRFTDDLRSEIGDNTPAFRSDGQLIFVPSGNGIGVYLNRE